MNNYVGKTLKGKDGKEYIILSELNHKNIPCAYVMELLKDDKDGEKKFMQIITDESGIYLIDIASEKMLNELADFEFKKGSSEKPRKIKEDESISDYFTYLDDFYKAKVVTIL